MNSQQLPARDRAALHPSAIIIIFPHARRLGRIQRTARAMAAADRKWAEAHLQTQLCRLTKRLEQLGQPLEAIAHEYLAFEQAVRRELQRASRALGGAA